MKSIYITKRIILPAALLIVSSSSCRKEIVDLNNDTKIPNNGSQVIISEDDLLRKITFSVPVQNVKTSVKDNVLTMVYSEDVSALLNPKGYELSYSIRLNEDFTASALSKYSFTVPSPGGQTTNWAGNDLKVLTEVTKSNLIVDGKNMVKLQLKRNFTFTKTFPLPQDAVNQQNILLNTKTDVVKFSSFVNFGKNYPLTTASILLVYSK